MRFGSVCSGIEAASAAWDELGWEVAWVSEVDVSASQVLAHRLGATAPRYPMDDKTAKATARLQWGDRLTNWGDMTRLPELISEGVAEAPDILCGGTPCQGFSLAGLRGGLDDPRGQLTLSFIEIANSIDNRRSDLGQEPCVIFWENVPGVRSDSGNAFGHFLAGLVGLETPLEPGPRPEHGRDSAHWSWKKEAGEHVPKWPSAGVAAGPRRTVAWRSCDAQFFALAQRRERVFVVASALEGFDPAAILLEFDGVRRDSAPSRDAGEGFARAFETGPGGGSLTDLAPTLDTRCKDGPIRNQLGVGIFEPSGPDGSVLTPTWWDGRPVSQTLDAVLHKGQTMPEKDRFPAVLHPVEVLPFNTTQITSPENGSNQQWGDPCFSLARGNHPPAVAIALRGREEGSAAEMGDDVAFALRASGGGGDKPHVLAFNARQDPVVYGDVSGSIGTKDTGHAIGFSSKDYGADATSDLAPTMRAMNHSGSHANAGGQLAVAYPLLEVGARTGVSTDDPRAGIGIGIGNDRDPMFTLQASKQHGVCVTGDVTHTLRAEGFDGSEDGTGRGNPIVTHEMLVRRLLPVECERLQGFKDGWTDVPTGNRRAADGPRYKQLGNSWPVPVVRWIGRRIQKHLNDLRAEVVDLSPEQVGAEIIWLLLP